MDLCVFTEAVYNNFLVEEYPAVGYIARAVVVDFGTVLSFSDELLNRINPIVLAAGDFLIQFGTVLHPVFVQIDVQLGAAVSVGSIQIL